MRRLLIAAITIVSLLSAVRATAAGFAIAPKASTLGAGADLVFGVSPHVNFRLGAQAYSLTRELTHQNIDYEGDADLSSANALIDFHPRGGNFRFTVGAVFHENEFRGRSTEDTIVVVNGVPYRVADVGHITAVVIPTEDWGPYAGFGFGNPLMPGSRWRLNLDIGAFYQGEPDVELVAVPNNGVPLPPGFAANLEEEERLFEEDARDYKFWPVVSLGFSVRF